MISQVLASSERKRWELIRLQTRLAVSRWVDPMPYEPGHGLFVRIAEHLRFDNAADLARRCGLEGGFPNPDEILFALQQLPLKGREELARWTPVVTATEVMIAGQAFKRNDWSVATRRYCPTCMVEGSYHRAWWDFKFMRRCPLHDQDLTNVAPDSSELDWRDPAFVQLGNELRRKQQPKATELTECSFESYVLGRLGVLPKPDSLWLDELSMADVADVVRWTGKLAIGGWQRETPGSSEPELHDSHLINAGYHLARSGEQSVVRLLVDVGRNCPEYIPSLQHSFGWIYPCLMAVNRREGSKRMLGLLREAAETLGVTGLRYKYQVTNRLSFAISDVMAITRLPKGAVLNLAKHADLGIEKNRGGKPLRFDRAQLASILATLDSSYDRAHAARRIGLDQQSFDRLSRKGRFGIPIRRCAKDDRQDRFSIKALDAFVHQILDRCHPMPLKSSPSATLVDVIQRTGCPSDEVIEQILRYRIPLRTRWPKKLRRSSIAEVRVLLEDLPDELKVTRRARTNKRVRPAAKDVKVVCRTRAAGMLGVPISVIDTLADHLVLRRARKPNGQIWRGNLEAASVASVAESILSTREIGHIIGKSTTTVAEEVLSAGLFTEPVGEIDPQMLRQLGLVSREGALRVFGKSSWMFSRAGFWRDLDWYLHRSQSAFMRKRQVSRDAAEFWTTSRKTLVRVGFGSRHFLEFMCRISTRYDAHSCLQRDDVRSALYECWSGLEIDREADSGDYILTFGIAHHSVLADSAEQTFFQLRTVLESFDFITSSTKEHEQLNVLSLKFLQVSILQSS